MNRLQIRRVIIKDLGGNYYRICNICNPIDKYKEPYLKIMFPDLKYDMFIETSNDAELNITGRKLVSKRINEFSYHYINGISHYKSSSKEYYDQGKNLPKLKEKILINILRISIHSISGLKPFNKIKVTNKDLVLNNIFDGNSRCLEFQLSSDPDIRIINVGPTKQLAIYEWKLDQSETYLCLSDDVYLVIPDGISLIDIFKYNDPSIVLNMPKFSFKFLKQFISSEIFRLFHKRQIIE